VVILGGRPGPEGAVEAPGTMSVVQVSARYCRCWLWPGPEGNVQEHVLGKPKLLLLGGGVEVCALHVDGERHATRAGI